MPLYFILSLIWGFVWLIVFFLRKGMRKKMLIMSGAVILFSSFDYFSRPGYWHPPTFFSLPVGIEDILFGFSFGGIAAVLYPVKTNKDSGSVNYSVAIKNMAALSPVLIISIGLNVLFDINIMISLMPGLLTGCLLIMIIRQDLAKRLLYSGLYFGLLYLFILSAWFWLFPQAQAWWNLKIYGDITVLNVPLGEVLFGFLFGAFWGSLYEFLFGYKLE
jgi:Lycopene cyclase